MANLTTIQQGSERPVLTITWTHADNTTGEDLTGATITGYIKDLATGDVVEIQGTFAITDATAGVFTWTPDPLDVATDGAYQVQFAATFAGEPTPARTAVFEWEIVESIIPTDPPTELPDYQGVVKLLARTTDPDNPPANYYGLYVKSGAFYLRDSSGNVTLFDDGSIAAAAAVAAHVALADPHTQYLTEAAAASTYATAGHNHDATYAPVSHTHAVTDVTDLGEYVQDTAAAMITGATHTNVSVSYDDTAGTLAITAAPTFTAEDAQDAAAGMITGATHTNISVVYDDNANTLAFTAAPTYTDEMAQDTVAAALAAGTHVGVSVAYDDAGAAISLTNTDGGAAAVTTHEGASDPHPEYLTQTEGDALYAPITVTQYTDEMAQDAAASLFTTATHDGVSVVYTDAGGTLAITNADKGSAAVSTHVGLADPHTQYLLESDANWTDLTDGGATTLHTHAGGGIAWMPTLTTPVLSDFSWVTQGTATATEQLGGITLVEPGHGNTASARILKRAAPATPYTITAAFSLGVWANKMYNILGLCFRQSSDGKLHTWGLLGTTSANLYSAKWTSDTAYDSPYTTYTTEAQNVVWLRISDNGTNRVCSHSFNGISWQVLDTIGRTDYLTADQVGFFVDAWNVGAPEWDVAAHLIHWAQS
jgi:hypothetical protein